MAAPSKKTADWIAFVTDWPPGGIGSAGGGFTERLETEEQVKAELTSLKEACPYTSPDWIGTFEQLCTSTDDVCEEQRREFLESLDDSEEEPASPLPKKLRNDFRAWLDEQVGYWQY